MSTLTTLFNDIASAIKTKKGTTAKIKASNFPSEILSIKTAPANLCEVTVTSADTSQGTVSPSGSISSGLTIQVIATPKSGYKIKEWKKGTSVIGTSNTASALITANTTLTATFQPSDTLTSSSLGNSAHWNLVVYGKDNNTFVALAYGQNYARYSLDGAKTWNKATITTGTSQYFSGAYGNEEFLLVQGNATLKRSYGGGQWTNVTGILPSGTWKTIIFDGTKFIAFSDTNAAYGSNSSSAWTSVALPSNKSWLRGAYGNGVYIVLSSTSSSYLYSTNGTGYQEKTLSIGTCADVCYGSRFVVVGTNIAAHSTNGVTWTSVTPPTGTWKLVKAIGSVVLAAETNVRSCKLMYSTNNGVSWKLMSQTLENVSEIAAGTDRFVIVCGGTSGDPHINSYCLLTSDLTN